MLAVSNGRHILMSTPWGKRGHFYEAWENGSPSWERIHISAYDCPQISPEFLAEEKSDMPETWFQSEYLGIFSDTADSVFTYAHVMDALSGEVEPWKVKQGYRFIRGSNLPLQNRPIGREGRDDRSIDHT
jgi:hypothetical protein